MPPRFALRVVAAPRGGVARLGAARRRAGRRKVIRKALRVYRCRSDDDLEVGPARQELAQVAEQKVDIQAAFVRFVNDDGVVGAQQRVGLRLGQQDAVCHQLDRGVAAQAVLKAHFEADHLAQRGLEFFGNALGHAGGGYAPGLRVADQRAATAGVIELAAAHGQGDLGQLGGLARACFTTDDDHLVRGNGGRDFVALARHRKRFGELNDQGGG